MKETITTFINGLVQYDYILFGAVFALFFLILILALVLRKRSFISGFLALLSFVILFVGTPVGYIKMHEYLFANSVKLLSQKQLSFTPAIVIIAELRNESKKDFSSCKITASVLKVSKKSIKTFLYQFKPLKKMSIVQEDIQMGETRSFKMIIEPFHYAKDYNITLKADCI
jgi:hypothetical protein